MHGRVSASRHEPYWRKRPGSGERAGSVYQNTHVYHTGAGSRIVTVQTSEVFKTSEVY
jgi:hypothetical protein